MKMKITKEQRDNIRLALDSDTDVMDCDGNSVLIADILDDLDQLEHRIGSLECALKRAAGEPCLYRSDVDCCYRWGDAHRTRWCASCEARYVLGISRKGETT